MRREREWQRRFEYLAAAVREFAKYQDQLESTGACADADAHTKAYRKMRKLAKPGATMKGEFDGKA